MISLVGRERRTKNYVEGVVAKQMSVVVDEGSPQVVVDSVDSYFPADNYGGCMGPVERVQSEQEDGSDDGRSYLDVFVASETENQNHEEGEALGWWTNMYYVG